MTSSVKPNYSIYTNKGLYRILSRTPVSDPEFNRVKAELKKRGYDDRMMRQLEADYQRDRDGWERD